MKQVLREDDYKAMTMPIAAIEKTFTGEEVKALCKKAGVKYQAGDEANVVVFEASNQVPDREGDIMLMDGADFTDFKRNPVFCWVHETWNKTIGAVINLEIDKSNKKAPRLLATCLFHQVTEEARELCELTKLGYLKAVSIGFRNKRGGIKFPLEAEREALGMIPGGVIHTAWSLVELSLCPIGMNQDALRVRSLHSKTIALLKGVGDATIPDKATTVDEELDMKPEDFKKALQEGIVEALPAVAAAVAAEIKKADTPPKPSEAVPEGAKPPEAPAGPHAKAFTPFMLANPDIFGKPDGNPLEAINARMAGKV